MRVKVLVPAVARWEGKDYPLPLGEHDVPDELAQVLETAKIAVALDRKAVKVQMTPEKKRRKSVKKR